MAHFNTLESSVHYYNDNADAFIGTTQSVNMQDIYRTFLPELKLGSAILDAGCGSGRDALNFKKMGYSVDAFDASEAMAKATSQLIRQPVSCCTFLEYETQSRFSAIWACASLLHIPFAELPKTFNHLRQFLLDDGIFVVSFKYGDSERRQGSRHFTDMNEERLAQVVDQLPDLSILKTWLTTDNRPQNATTWLNAIIGLN